MRRRDFIHGLGLSAFASDLLAREPLGERSEYKIAFGSCLNQNANQPIWNAIAERKPDLFIFLGDNVYADTDDMALMAECYAKQARRSEFRRFSRQVPIIATWDDHDYGCDDSGCEYPRREESKEIMLDFFREPRNSERRQREGIYTSYYLGSGPSRVQIVLLDLRWFRSKLKLDPILGYQPTQEPGATLLGAQQWAWLEQELRKPAAHRIVASSIQLISAEHRWEKWANFPKERNRLLQLINPIGARHMTILSGDMHFGEISRVRLSSGWLYEVTSSGLTHFESAQKIPNRSRLAVHDTSANFGLITLGDKSRQYEICDEHGRTRVLKKAL